MEIHIGMQIGVYLGFLAALKNYINTTLMTDYITVLGLRSKGCAVQSERSDLKTWDM